MPICPVCGGKGEVPDYPYADKEERNRDIKKVGHSLRGKSQKFILSKIVEYLRAREDELSKDRIRHILKKKVVVKCG